jgi:hypothetical protein
LKTICCIVGVSCVPLDLVASCAPPVAPATTEVLNGNVWSFDLDSTRWRLDWAGTGVNYTQRWYTPATQAGNAWDQVGHGLHSLCLHLQWCTSNGKRTPAFAVGEGVGVGPTVAVGVGPTVASATFDIALMLSAASNVNTAV